MIDIGANLLRAQRARSILAKHLLVRCVLTYSATTKTYNTTRIKRISDVEQAFGHKAQVLLDDSDKVLHGLDLEGYKAVLSYGLITKAGAEWIAMPPLWVVGQARDSYRDRLECYFELEGTFNRMGKHKAISNYSVDSTDTQTVKDLLTGIADTTLTDGTNTPFDNYPAYTITFDSGYDDDGLIDTFIPADGFRVGLNETRLAKFKELLNYTEAVARIGNDGEIHIFTPVTSGTTYSNEYNLVSGRDNHNFFNKRYRRRIVSPNKIGFESHPNTDGYAGSAKDASADLTDMLEVETHLARATSNTQCDDLAAALLSKKQMEAEKGSFVLPFIHFGQELYDYVNVVDARAGDSRAGNIGHLSRHYEPGQFNMSGGFGRVPIGLPSLQGLKSESGGDSRFVTYGALDAVLEQIYSNFEIVSEILGDKVDQSEYDDYITIQFFNFFALKATISRELNIPSEAA